ncbi:MAG: DUF4012 domain-containing protein [Actinomycetota bacterium]
MLGVVVLVLGVIAGMALMLRALPLVLDARAEMRAGREAFVRGDMIRASRAFRQAGSAFDEALDRLHNPFTRLAAFFPLLGRTPDAVVAGVEAGGLMASAARITSGAAERLPGGVSALVPRRGVIPLQPLRVLAPLVRDARVLADRSDRVLRGAPRSLVPGLVLEPLELLSGEVAEARRALVSAEAMIRALPDFLGGDGTRRYFFGAQNPAELRGTGGLIGAYAILTVADGHLELGPFRPVGTLDSPDPASIDPPSDEYADLYPGQHAVYENLNMTPDFPTAATAIERLYEHQTGERLDGTVVADPHALALLIGATGPAIVSATGTTLTEEDVVSFVSNEAFALLPDPSARKRILGEVAGQVLVRFLRGGAVNDPWRAGRKVAEATAGGHLLFHSVDREVQAAFETAGVAGRLLDPPGDFLAVVVNNAGGSKIDFYAGRTIRYEVRLLQDGLAEGRTRLTFVNDAPTGGQPAYVIGPNPRTDARVGDNTMIVGVYCAGGCSFRGFRRDGEPEGLVVGRELGHPETMTGYRIPSGESGTLEYQWVVPDAWREEDGRVVYRLTFQDQPTIRATSLHVAVRIPEGAEVARTTSGMRVVGDRVVWDGEAGGVMRFEVSFSPPLLGG